MKTIRMGVLVAVATIGATGLGACGSDDEPAKVDLGPGASLKCTSSGKNAWETYKVGGFVAVNESIVGNVVSDNTANGTTKLGSSFGPVLAGNRPNFKGNLAAFLVYAYGGPTEIEYTDKKKYTGPQDMVKKHTGLAITSDQYDYFVNSIVVPALTNNGVPGGDVTSCFAPILVDPAFKASIVGK